MSADVVSRAAEWVRQYRQVIASANGISLSDKLLDDLWGVALTVGFGPSDLLSLCISPTRHITAVKQALARGADEQSITRYIAAAQALFEAMDALNTASEDLKGACENSSPTVSFSERLAAILTKTDAEARSPVVSSDVKDSLEGGFDSLSERLFAQRSAKA